MNMIGKYARSIAGHDKGTLYIVVKCEDKKVLVADGKLKKVSDPKMKNKKHLQIMNKSVDEKILDMIQKNVSNVDDEIRLAIKREEKDV